VIQRQRIFFEDQPGHVAQEDRGIIEIAQASQLVGLPQSCDFIR
jgi:hypothetical protein